MLYATALGVVFSLFLGWRFKELFIDCGRSWYFGVPLPKHGVLVDEHVSIPMPDGIRLVGDIYRPANRGEFPAIIVRTPYGRQNAYHKYQQIAKLFAGQGFVVVVQDVRGKRPSEGDFYPHRHDPGDGAETISWVVNQPWSDGQVAFFGFSALAISSWQAAFQARHRVVTLVPWFAGSNPYKLWHDNEVSFLKQHLFWMCTYGGEGCRDILHEEVDQALAKTTEWHLLDERLTGGKIPAYRDFLEHYKFDDFWKQFFVSLPEMAHDIPVLLGSGWYDQFLKPTIEDFQALRQSPEGSRKKESRLVLGPWTHNPVEKIKLLSLGRSANFLNQFAIMLGWYKKWMKADKTFTLAPVSYYVMGKNKWCVAADWPPKEAVKVQYYLTPFNSLSLRAFPVLEKRSLSFDPKDFVPSVGGRMLYSNGKDGPQDQSYLKKRRDVLFWSSDPLQQELVVVGSVKVCLYLGKTPKDFDLSIKLIDLFPSGKMQFITDGYMRVERGDEPLFSLTIPLTDTAYAISLNHRLQIAITHSDFPGREPNKQLMKFRLAEVEFLTGPEHLSSIELLSL